MKLLKIISNLLLVLALVSCASTGRKEANAYKKFLNAGKYDKALTVVKSSKFFPEKRNELLKTLELATAHHLNGNYYQSLKYFDKAKNISDKLYTVSISKKVTSAVSNSNADNFYGEKYEQSLIRFYQALNHYLLYQKGEYEAYSREVEQKDPKDPKKKIKVLKPFAAKKLSKKERRRHLDGARAVILEWDSLLKNYKGELAGNTKYKDDMLAKVFGAFIHEEVGTRTDKGIAKQLYKDANQLLFRNYNSYPTFNTEHKKFRSDFKKFPTMKKKDVVKNYVKETHYQKELKSYLKKKKKRKGNVKVLLQHDFIAPKKARKIYFPIDLGAAGVISGNKGLTFVGFVTNALKLSRAGKPAIAFELPEVSLRPTKQDHEIIVFDESGKKEIKRVKATLIHPLSDVAYEALDEKIASTYAKVGTRLAVKHIAAMTTAYIAYKTAVNRGTPSFLAQVMGAGMYAAANKGIQASEKADIRQWASLPHGVRMADLNLKKGKYLFKLNVNGKTQKLLGKVEVNGKKRKLVNFRIK